MMWYHWYDKELNMYYTSSQELALEKHIGDLYASPYKPDKNPNKKELILV